MQQFFEMIIGFCQRFLQILDSYYFYIYGYKVTILGVMVAVLILGMTINVFWKGSKT